MGWNLFLVLKRKNYRKILHLFKSEENEINEQNLKGRRTKQLAM